MLKFKKIKRSARNYTQAQDAQEIHVIQNVGA